MQLMTITPRLMYREFVWYVQYSWVTKTNSCNRFNCYK